MNKKKNKYRVTFRTVVEGLETTRYIDVYSLCLNEIEQCSGEELTEELMYFTQVTEGEPEQLPVYIKRRLIDCIEPLIPILKY